MAEALDYAPCIGITGGPEHGQFGDGKSGTGMCMSAGADLTSTGLT